jgi:hypothetical protein
MPRPPLVVKTAAVTNEINDNQMQPANAAGASLHT